MSDDVKLCRKCGDPFITSRTGATVHCPSCRRRDRSPQPLGYAHRSQHFKCKTCGKDFVKGAALRHRRETGHQF